MDQSFSLNESGRLLSDRYKSDSLIEKKRLVCRTGHFNHERAGISWWVLYKADVYHYILNLSWWKLVILSLLSYTMVNLIFAFLYYLDQESIIGALHFFDCFYFSVETMSTIGFGYMRPLSYYVHTIVFFQSWVGMLFEGVIVAIVFAKVSRPSRLRHTIQFSSVSVVNDSPFPSLNQVDESDIESPERSYFKFRFVNLRKRQVCDTKLTLMVLQRNLHANGRRHYDITEIPFTINNQVGRSVQMNFSTLLTPLPWTVVHEINEESPLYGKSPAELLNLETEIIATFEGVDELTSNSIIRHWSYTTSEIMSDCEFSPMVKRNLEGNLETDILKLSDITLQGSI